MTVMIDAEYVLKIIGDQLYGEMSAGDEYLYDHKTYDDGLEWCFELIRNVANNTQETILVKPPHWISVKDRLPGYEMMVMVYSELCGVGLAFIDNRDEKWCGDCHDEDVLYWMPLPEPPEIDND